MKRRHQIWHALVTIIIVTSACSSPEPSSDLDSGTALDSTISDDVGASDGELRDTAGVDARVECPRVCKGESCTYVTNGENLPFDPPDNLPVQEGPVTFAHMDGVPAGVSGITARGDERWPGHYHYGSFVPHGESFRASIGIQARMRSTTEGPYRVQVGVLVDYEFVEFTYRAPVRGRESDFSSGTVTEATFEIPEFPLIIDFELSADTLGDKGLRDVVFLIRSSDLERTDAHRYAQRFSVFYGGNTPAASHPCFKLGPIVEVTEQESKLFRGTYFTYFDETTYQEQSVDETQEWIGAEQNSIDLTLGIPPSQRVQRPEMPEVFFLFRNEELILKEYRARHSSGIVDVQTQLSDRQTLTIDLPLNEERFEIWGFAVQYPFEPEIDYATGALIDEIWNEVDSPTGSLKTPTYRIQRRAPD